MALTKNVNSYVTVNEADVYFEDRLDAAAWTSATSSQKSQALITATRMLDNLSWKGSIEDTSQLLAFPRAGSFFDPKYGAEFELNSVYLYRRLYPAVFELAYHLLNNDGLLDSTGSIDEISVGSIKLTNIVEPNVLPKTVSDSIKPLLETGSTTARSWWRAN